MTENKLTTEQVARTQEMIKNLLSKESTDESKFVDGCDLATLFLIKVFENDFEQKDRVMLYDLQENIFKILRHLEKEM